MNKRKTIKTQIHSRVLFFHVIILGLVMFATIGLPPVSDCQAGAVAVPNGSFETPVVPPVSPYAGPDIDDWQKSPQPSWYDPSQNSNTPWAYLMGEFYNVSFPGQFIDNCDGNQAAFLFALPDVALFQDYSSVYGTNTLPSHSFNAKFNVGSSYDLTVAVLGGGGGMKPGVSLQLGLYYRDDTNNVATVASTSITNSATLFPTNTHFVDFTVHVAQVKSTDPWAGKNIGIQFLSTVGFDLAGGYWDLDNVRLIETSKAGVALGNMAVTNGTFVFNVQGPPGTQFEIQAATNLNANTAWIKIGGLTNVSGVASFIDTATNLNWRFYRARQL
ncbi:MAG TPA: hypothetical protein VKY92_19275 [Verrucomicrobiae bacterium]|nr:hypothetical protein [Verrucomicrobiae bacterium]